MGLLDQMNPTQRNGLLGLLSDALNGVNDYTQRKDPTMPGGLANPALAGIASLLGLPAVATTAERMSYGEPLTNAGKANVPFLRPETADAAMAVAPMIPALSRGALRASDSAVRAITGNPMATATGVLDYARGMSPAMNPATVWHGSPHKFDAFDSSKIGTGEGAQAYGHGLYLAEAKKVADEYAGKLSSKNVTIPGFSPSNSAENELLTALTARANSTQYGSAASAVMNDLWSVARHGNPTRKAAAQRMLDAMGNAGMPSILDAGSLYKVDLPDEHIAKMLDWDKPLSQQSPSVQAALESSLHPTVSHVFESSKTNMGYTGKDLYERLSSSGQNGSAAEFFRQQGIPGIRYLDGGSRGVGDGTRNYVIFPGNEGLLSILERNGVPLK